MRAMHHPGGEGQEAARTEALAILGQVALQHVMHLRTRLVEMRRDAAAGRQMDNGGDDAFLLVLVQDLHAELALGARDLEDDRRGGIGRELQGTL